MHTVVDQDHWYIFRITQSGRNALERLWNDILVLYKSKGIDRVELRHLGRSSQIRCAIQCDC